MLQQYVAIIKRQMKIDQIDQALCDSWCRQISENRLVFDGCSSGCTLYRHLKSRVFSNRCVKIMLSIRNPYIYAGGDI